MNLYELIKKHPTIKLDSEDLTRYGFWQSNLHQGYVVTRYLGIKKALHLHIVQPPAGYEVDHADRNPLNNLRENLRVATRANQEMNKTISARNNSGYKGVWFNKLNNNWRARIAKGIGGKSIYIELGSFNSAVAAAKEYDKFAKIFHGKFAVLNFGEVITGDIS